MSSSKTFFPALLVLWGTPFLFLIWFGYLKVTDREFARFLVYESGWFEWFQFWCFLVSACGAGVVAWLHYRLSARRTALFFFLFALAVLFVALEEINWGQWILAIELPEFFVKNNTQKNLTLHNLKSIQPHLHLITMLGAGSITVVTFLESTLRSWNVSSAAIPKRYLTPYFLPIALFYLGTDYLSKRLVDIGYTAFRVGFDHRETIIIFSDQEAFECLVALGTLLFTGRAVRLTVQSLCAGHGAASQRSSVSNIRRSRSLHGAIE